jgi:hypothetical protein
MNRPPPISVRWMAAAPVAPTRLQPSGHETQLLFASLNPKSKQPARAHRTAFIIAKPRTGSLKLIIGILQHNLKTRAFLAHPDHFASGRPEMCRVGTHPTRMDTRRPETPALPAKAVALPDIPRRIESSLIPSGIEITVGNTATPPSALVRASVPDTAICPSDALRDRDDPGVIDAPRSVIENDIDRRALLDGLKAVLRKHSNQRDLVLDDERGRFETTHRWPSPARSA